MTADVTPTVDVAWTPYTCSLTSSDVDLTLRDDLSSSVHDYLLRIIEELQNFSLWAIECHDHVMLCEQQQKQQVQKQATMDLNEVDPHEANSLLLLRTDLELLRRDLSVATQDVFQRCATQIAYVQNATRSDHEESLAQLAKNVDDQIRAVVQPVVATESLLHANELRIRALEGRVEALEQQLDQERSRLLINQESNEIFRSTITTGMSKHQHELVGVQRHIHSVEATSTMQWNELKGSMHDISQSMRDNQSQISSKLQLVRHQIQEQMDEFNKKMMQLSRSLSRLNATSSSTPNESGTSVKMVVGAASLTSASDCFQHAKATLPPTQRSTTAINSIDKTKKNTVSIPSKRWLEPRRPSEDRMGLALQIQSSILCPTIGRETSDEEVRSSHQ